MGKKSFFKQTNTVSANSATTLLEVNKPSKFLKAEIDKPAQPHRPLWWNRWFGVTGLSALIVALGLIFAAGWWFVTQFENASGINVTQLAKQYRDQQNQTPAAKKNEITFLLLGLDQSDNQRETSLLTDTIILARLNKTTKKIDLVSIPRDLWIKSLQTKINALYYYGQQQDNNNGGITLVESVVKEISGIATDYYVVTNMDDIKLIIDAIGGVEVEVERGFEDKLYPREIDLSSTDPAVLYQTVVFKSGKELMDGNRALQYIRSRHSEDKFEGTDEGRELRQQRLLGALRQALTQPKTVTNPQVIGKLYRVWKDAFKSNLTDTDLLTLIKAMALVKPEIESRALPVQDASSSGVIYHPPKGPAGQWVYLPVDETWAQIQDWFKQ